MRRKNKKDKINIITFFANIPTFIYILPIVILQNFLFDPAGFWEHITSYTLSFFLLIVFGAFSAADYRTKKYKTLPDQASVKEGILFQKKFSLPYDKLQSVIIQSSPFTMLFSAVKIQLNTAATKAKKGDAVFYLSKENAKRLITEIYDDIGYIHRYYHAKNSRIFLMAAIWSNPVSGFLILSPVVNNIGKIVGSELKTQLISSFDFSKYLVYIGISPTTAFIAYFLIVCYLVSVAADFFRTSNFTCTAYQKGIVIKRGIIRKTLFFTNPSKLNAITINSSIFMIPLRLCSAYIYTVGAGKPKGDRSLLIAAERKKTVKHLLEMLFPDLDFNFSLKTRPAPNSIRNFLRLPLYVMSGLAAALILLSRLGVSEWIIVRSGIFAAAGCILWCFFRVAAFRNSELLANERFVYVKSFRRITLRSTLIPIDKIQFCVKRVGRFQQKTCAVRIYIYGEKRTFVQIKHLSQSSADRFLNLINRQLSTKQ